MNDRAKFLFSFVGTTVVGIPTYIFLHELGHTLVAMACGAKITHFSIFTASMSAEGGTYTVFTQSLLHAAGMLFPYIVFILLLLTFQKKRQGTLYMCIYNVMAMLCIYPLIAWVMVPVMYLIKPLSANDDVVKFIQSSGLSPVVILIGALLLMAIAIFIIYKKHIFHAFKNIIKNFDTKQSEA